MGEIYESEGDIPRVQAQEEPGLELAGDEPALAEQVRLFLECKDPAHVALQEYLNGRND